MSSRLPPAVRQVIAIICVAGATVIPTYISGALTVALPSIGADIGLSGPSLQWPLSGFSLINGAFLLLSGGIADGTSKKTVFIIGNAWIVVFSIPLMLRLEANAFIALCSILGLGSAMLGPSATGILSETLPDGKMKNMAFAALGAGQPTGFIVGLFFGGVFATKRAVIFAVAAGAAVLFGGMAAIFVDKETPSADTPSRRISLLRFDWLGAALSGFGLVGLSLSLTLAGTTDAGWNTPTVLSLLPIGVALLAGFFVWERQSQRNQTSATATAITASSDPAQRYIAPSSSRQHTLRGPLIPPSIWSAPGFTPALLCGWFAWFSFNSLTYYANLFFQEVQFASPVQTSVRYLPMVAAGIIANVAAGLLMARVRLVYLLLAGCLCGAAGAALYALQGADWVYARGMLPVVILIVGPDLFFPGIQLFACNSVGSHRAALAGSLFNVTTRLATSIGLAFCALAEGAGTKQYARTHGVSVHDVGAKMAGYQAAGWLCFGASMVATLIAVVFLRKTSIHAGKLRLSSDIALNELPPVTQRSGTPTPPNEASREKKSGSDK